MLDEFNLEILLQTGDNCTASSSTPVDSSEEESIGTSRQNVQKSNSIRKASNKIESDSSESVTIVCKKKPNLVVDDEDEDDLTARFESTDLNKD